MSKIQNNPLLKGASGMLGDVVVFREVRGKMVMSNRPKPSTNLTEQQVTTRAKFQRAVLYAKKQMESPLARAEYEAGITEKKFTAYVVAVTDYLKAPVVHEVDTSRYNGAVGDTIVIRATDDFKVIMVQVSVIGPDGALLEFGDAILTPETVDEWRYTATVANAATSGSKIAVTARDKAGNVTTAEKVI